MRRTALCVNFAKPIGSIPESIAVAPMEHRLRIPSHKPRKHQLSTPGDPWNLKSPGPDLWCRRRAELVLPSLSSEKMTRQRADKKPIKDPYSRLIRIRCLCEVHAGDHRHAGDEPIGDERLFSVDGDTNRNALGHLGKVTGGVISLDD